MKLNSPIACEEIAKIVDGKIQGNQTLLVYELNRIEAAKKGDLTFFADKKYEKYLQTTQATCVIVPLNYQNDPSSEWQVFIRVANPYFAFFTLLNHLDTYYQKFVSFIHPSAIIGNNCSIHPTAYIGPYCIIGDNCSVGEGSKLMGNVVLYDNVEIGNNTLIHSNVVCYYNTKIGNECIIHGGAVIGSDGFGFIENKDGSYTKIPQLGNVVIGNSVEIGANTTIDRAVVGSTIIEDGVKIDNLVQIAHNVHIGENSAMAAQVGISGSTKIGKRNRLAGQVGIAGHLEITDDVTIEAKSGVPKSILESGVYFGAPPKKKAEAFRILMASNELPELLRQFSKLKKILKEKFNIELE